MFLVWRDEWLALQRRRVCLLVVLGLRSAETCEECGIEREISPLVGDTTKSLEGKRKLTG